MAPLISIITVNYNNKLGLELTLKSIQDQTFTNYEHIIIDGNSNDGSKNILEEYRNNLSFWVSEPDDGIYDAMNKGIEKSSGDYLLFLNSGDSLFANETLNKASSYLKLDKDIVYGNLLIHKIGGHQFLYDYPQSFDLDFLINSSLGHPSTFIKKSLFKTYGDYRTDLKIVSDWEFFIKLSNKKYLSKLKLNLVISNFFEGGVSTLLEVKNVHTAERQQVLIENFNLFAANYYKKRKELEDKTMLLNRLDEDLSILTSNKIGVRLLNTCIKILAFFVKIKRRL